MGTNCHPRAKAETRSQDAGWTGLRPQQVSGPWAKTFLGLEHESRDMFLGGSEPWLVLANLMFLSQSVTSLIFSLPQHNW